MTEERKVLPLTKASVTGTGEFTGLAAVFGNVDDGGDVILPGFFEPVIDEFLKDGFYSWGHDWGIPIAMPTAAKESEVGLEVGGQFHSTDRAQEKRTITSERLDAGKSMGLSIGYESAETQYRDDGVRLLIKAKRLFEVAFTLVPMNRLAGVGGVKEAGMSYAENSQQLIKDVREFIDRTKHVVQLRSDGRSLSDEWRSRLGGLDEALAAASSDLKGLLASPPDEEAEKSAAIADLDLLFIETQARLDGHLITA